jgi:hypothetical protein
LNKYHNEIIKQKIGLLRNYKDDGYDSETTQDDDTRSIPVKKQEMNTKFIIR